MDQEKLDNIVEFLDEFCEDATVPKNVKSSISEILILLKSDMETSIKIDKIHNILDELHDDSNIDNYTRTQLWNLMSMIDLL